MILCIDFDNTLMDTQNVPPGRRMGVPIQGAVGAMQHLASQGNTLIIFTVRGGKPEARKAVEDWLDYFKIPFSTVTNIKTKADFYIDDLAIHFQNWAQTINELTMRKHHED